VYAFAPAQNPIYKQVKVQHSQAALEQLASNGFSIDYIAEGEYILLSLSGDEIESLRGSGLKYEVTIQDLTAFYLNRNAGKNPDETTRTFRESGSYAIPEGFSLGSMGGFCTYSELLTHLNFMADNYPDLITPIDTIEGGLTVEGRPVYWTKISDNPHVNEDEPEVLYTSLIHAREPASMQQMLFFMYYLLENYNTDDDIKKLVDNTEMYFIPCINPDGYLYNESQWPEGGGYWRKNRRLNQNNTYGVDLNRNFGYEWGHDDFGSSPSPVSSTYRGPEPFSEPETQLLKSFCEEHEFCIAMNYHSYGDFILHPWGYVSYLYSSDHELFQTYGKLLSSKNHYRYDNPGSLIYLVNGDSNDWLYGERDTKPMCIALTPEIGSEEDGFWPEIERIIPLCIESMHQNLEAAKLASEYILVCGLCPFNLSQSNAYFKFNLQNVGLKSADISVTIEGIGDHFIEIGPALSIGFLDTLENKVDSISYRLKPGIIPGEIIQYIMHVESGNFKQTDTIQKVFGPSTVLFADSCNSMTHWESEVWNITTQSFHSAPSSITDSPNGYYPNKNYSSIQLTDTIDLSQAVAASLQFYTRWRLDGGKDYVTCRVSSNYGVGWTAMKGKYTSTNFVPYNDNLPVYYGKQDDWVAETIDLSAFCGEQIMLKFTLNSDALTNKDGFYFDDLVVKQISAESFNQEINLIAGWNSLSSYLIPGNKNLETIFGSNLTEVLMMQGQQGFFQPQNPETTIHTWDSHSGYTLKVSDNITLEIPGFTEFNRQIELAAGWNLTPVISATPIAVEDLNIQPAGSMEIVRQPIGKKIYWPSESIYSLDSLRPGRSYLIKVNQAGVVEF
jgi:hypothetical protein